MGIKGQGPLAFLVVARIGHGPEPMRILVLNGAGGGAIAALVEHGTRRLGEAERHERGGAERLATMVRDLLGSAGWGPADLDLVACVVGPGSFTGLRASLSLAHGLALGLGVPLCGVTLMEALRQSVGDRGGRPLWCVCVARRDRVFLERDAGLPAQGCALDALPVPDRPVWLAGDASALVAARIPRVERTGVERPTAAAIATIALQRHQGALPPIATLPLYVDPPAALPAAGARRLGA